jgi:SAM-dependent methyltransferase
MAGALLEITDLLWPFDADRALLPVMKADVVARLTECGQDHAARIVSRMPVVNGALDPGYVDALGLRVHRELQRLGEELQFGRRVAAALGPVVAELRRSVGSPVRIVDVGCGLGFVVRSLASTSVLGPDVELVGVDLNSALIAEAARLAKCEGLACRFIQGDAFEPAVAIDDGPGSIVISSGLMHHLPASGLAEFFAAQARLRVAAFAHWDIAPCLWSTIGAWVFHQARMREPVSRHDGVLSARRAHPAAVLQAAARAGAPAYDVRVLEGPRWHPRALDVLRPVAGTRI